MGKVFLDTNRFIDVVENRDAGVLSVLSGSTLFVSAITVGTWLYIYKKRVPLLESDEMCKTFQFTEVNADVVAKSFKGPTPDFENNVQLHSAVEAECDFFVTKDAGLLSLGYFGKTKIVSSL